MVSTGEKFGRWTVLAKAEDRGKNARWLCRCECGVERPVFQFALKNGESKSCGCLHREGLTTHGQYAGGGHSPEHKIWQGTFERCGNPNHKQFKDYGARGITVCDRWRDFEAFLADMGKRPSPRHSLDRIDNDRGYEPGNCRWATRREQARNRRSNKLIHYMGETRAMVEWAEKLGLPYKIVKNRILKGWSTDQALGTPYGPRAFRNR